MRTLLLLFMLFVSLFSVAQTQKQITGKIADSKDSNALPGITIRIKGSNKAITSSADGAFELSVPQNATLTFSGIGFKQKEIKIDDKNVYNIFLEPVSETLQDVVITGYTVQSRRQVTGSVSKLNADKVKLQPLGSFDKMLQGRIPGLLSQSQSGQPGAASIVTIRGKGSINGSNSPLYIVDGIEIQAGDFASINPADFASFTVLKDASSTSIYGSRGANGVIVITTKKGVAGKTQINYDVQFGSSELPKSKLQLMNSAQKLDYEVNYNRPEGKNPFGWTKSEIDSLSKINNHLQDIIFQKGTTQEHNLSASGGNDKTKFFLSGSVFNQQGVVLTTGLKRYTGRANIENSFGNFKIGLNATFGFSSLTNTNENDEELETPLNAIKWFNPYITIYNAHGKYQDDYLQGQPNPLKELLLNHQKNNQLKGIGNAYVEYNFPFVEGLKFKTVWGLDYTQNNGTLYYDPSTTTGQYQTGGNGALTHNYSQVFEYTGTSSLNYEHTFGDHFISASVYNEVIQSKNSGWGYTGYGLIGPLKNEAGISVGTASNGYIPVVDGYESANGLLSYFFDATYGFKKKYYVSAGARRDGSSRFGADHRFANFGQLGLSWIISDENFLQHAKNWLTNLKYKISYGTVGNQLGIGDYASLELFDPASYNGMQGLVLVNLANPNLQWERKLMFNTGFEFNIFNDRLTGSVEYYNNITQNLFLDKQLSRTSGFPSINTNLGKLQNKGLDISLDGDVISTKNFTWSLGVDYSYNKNKILDQAGIPKNINGLYINQTGQAADALYVVRYAGVDPQNGDALYYKADGKTITNIYDPNDAVIVGTTDPPYYGGFSTSVNYKNISLDVNFSYAYGNFLYNRDVYNVEYPVYWYSGLDVNMLSEWQKPGDITNVPSPFNAFHAETTRFVEKGNFLRFQNIMFSYDLPKKLLNKLRLNKISVFAQGENLYVWHHFHSYDPEVTSGTLEGAHYPQLKTITFGLSASL